MKKMRREKIWVYKYWIVLLRYKKDKVVKKNCIFN